MLVKTMADCLVPTVQEHVARATGDFRMGLPCLAHHNGAWAVIAPVETLDGARFDALRARFGPPELILTAHRALAVMTPAAASTVAQAPVRLRPPENAGLAWCQALVDPSVKRAGAPNGPLHQLRVGEDMPHRLALELTKAAELLPAALLFAVPSKETCAALALTSLEVEGAMETLSDQPAFHPVAAAGLPLEAHADSQLHVFRDQAGRTEHYALEIGTIDRSQPVLSRLHSACFTGDVLGSLKCDCGPQLRTALARIGQEGAGILLYLNQEGRGIGLANKMRVYDLQSKGFDTVEANHHLGFADDERDFRVAATMLRALGVTEIRLLTNNPAKVDTFEASGITIARQLPLRVARNVHNQGYLSIKALKSGHLL